MSYEAGFGYMLKLADIKDDLGVGLKTTGALLAASTFFPADTTGDAVSLPNHLGVLGGTAAGIGAGGVASYKFVSPKAFKYMDRGVPQMVASVGAIMAPLIAGGTIGGAIAHNQLKQPFHERVIHHMGF